MTTKTKYVPISTAARMLGASLNGIRVMLRAHRLRGRMVPQGKRLVREVELASIREYPSRFKRKTPLKGRRFNPHRRELTYNGYIEIFRPEHPRARCQGYVYEHTLVMEASLGRYLEPGEVVEHLNSVRFDNRIENLKLMSSQGAHKNWEYFKPLVMRGGDPALHKICSACDQIRSRSAFRKYPVSPDGLELYCKDCRTAALTRICDV